MTGKPAFAPLRNGQAIARESVPEVPFADFRATIVDAVASGKRVAALFGHDTGGGVELYALLADSRRALLRR